MTRVTKTALAELVSFLSLEAIEDENYDIINEGGFMPEEFALAASNIFKNLIVPDGHGGWKFKREPLSIYTLGCQWKVSNSRPCYISCSTDERTGVSRSESCIFGRIYGMDDADEVKPLLDMMNEAWFLATHNREDA